MNLLRSTRWAPLSAALALTALAGGTSALAATGGTTGGAPAPDPKAPGASQSSAVTLSAKHNAIVRRVARFRGAVARSEAGRTVSVQRRDSAAGWVAVATATVQKDGTFVTSWHPQHIGRIQVRAVLADSATGSAARASTPLKITIYHSAMATWYGPDGFYGTRTACGVVLHKSTLGVAHRHLPCGTKVAIYYRGRSVTVPVIDRGPYRSGVDWDLTGATRRKLHFNGLARVGTVALRHGR